MERDGETKTLNLNHLVRRVVPKLLANQLDRDLALPLINNLSNQLILDNLLVE
jgi:hypothetical protein